MQLEQTYPNVTGRDLTAIWGTGPNDIWAGGDGGTLIHYDGVSWSKNQNPWAVPEYLSTTWEIRDIWGDRPDNFYALMVQIQGDDDSNLLYWNGAKWQVLPDPPTGEFVGRKVFGFADGNVVVQGGDRGTPLSNVSCNWIWNGQQWTSSRCNRFDHPCEVGDFIGTLSSDFVTVSYSDLCEVINGTATVVDNTVPGASAITYWNSTIWAGGIGEVYRGKNGSWTAELLARATSDAIDHIFTPDGNVIWAIEDTGLYRDGRPGIHFFDGTAWTYQEPVEFYGPGKAVAENGFHAVWASAADNAWAVGDEGGIAHWDGQQWKYVLPEVIDTWINPFFITPMTRDHWFSRGSATEPNGDLIGHWEYKDGNWSLQTDVKGNRFAGTGPDNFWMAGETGSIYQWDNGDWSHRHFELNGVQRYPCLMHSIGPDVLWGIACESTQNLDTNDTFFRLKGGVFEEIPYPFDFRSGVRIEPAFVKGVSADEAWVLALQGIFHYQNGAWTKRIDGVLNDLDASSSDYVWMTARNGMYHWNGGELTHLETQGGFGNIEVVGYNHIYTNIAESFYRFDGFQTFFPLGNAGGMISYLDGVMFRQARVGTCQFGGYRERTAPLQPATIELGGWMTMDLHVGKQGVLSFAGLVTVQDSLFNDCGDLWPAHQLELYYEGLPTGIKPGIATGWNRSPSEPYALDIPLTPGAPLEPTIFDVYPMSSTTNVLGNPWPYLHVRE